MSKSRHAFLVPVFVLLSFVIFLFTNCDRGRFPKQPSVYVPPVEVPQAAQAVPEPFIPPTAESVEQLPPPPPVPED